MGADEPLCSDVDVTARDIQRREYSTRRTFQCGYANTVVHPVILPDVAESYPGPGKAKAPTP